MGRSPVASPRTQQGWLGTFAPQVLALSSLSSDWKKLGARRFFFGKAIMGGKEIPDRQGVMGYGPIRYLTPEEVRQVAEALAEFPIAARASAFDSVAAEEARFTSPSTTRKN